MVICLERCADLHMAQLMPLPLTVSCFSKIQIGITFLLPAYPGSPGQRTVKQVCVCARARTDGAQKRTYSNKTFQLLRASLVAEVSRAEADVSSYRERALVGGGR